MVENVNIGYLYLNIHKITHYYELHVAVLIIGGDAEREEGTEAHEVRRHYGVLQVPRAGVPGTRVTAGQRP